MEVRETSLDTVSDYVRFIESAHGNIRPFSILFIYEFTVEYMSCKLNNDEDLHICRCLQDIVITIFIVKASDLFDLKYF